MTMRRINFEDEVVIFHVLLLLASLSYIFFLTIFWHKISFLKNEAYKDFSKYSNLYEYLKVLSWSVVSTWNFQGNQAPPSSQLPIFSTPSPLLFFIRVTSCAQMHSYSTYNLVLTLIETSWSGWRIKHTTRQHITTQKLVW